MPEANHRIITDETGQDLVAALQNIAPLQVAPLVVSIPTGQWSGSGSDYYITVNASNVTANSIIVPYYDADSRSRLNGPVWCIPAVGSFTIHTSAIPSNTVTIMVQFPGTMGEAQYQVLADVYSKSQAVAKADIVNNLTSTATNKPLSAAMGKALKDSIWNFSTLTTAGAGSSATFTLAAGTRCAIFSDGVGASVQGVIIAACNVGGTNAYYNKLGASNLSVSNSATSITIANSASADAQLFAIIWKGSIT